MDSAIVAVPGEICGVRKMSQRQSFWVKGKTWCVTFAVATVFGAALPRKSLRSRP